MDFNTRLTGLWLSPSTLRCLR